MAAAEAVAAAVVVAAEVESPARARSARTRGDAEAAFDVLDLFGWATLEKRDPTLDGGVPLRVARACPPLLEGNAFGFQVSLKQPVVVRKGLTTRADLDPKYAAHLATLLRAACPWLAQRGHLDEPTARALEGSKIVQTTRRGVTIFTGLLVRPRAHVGLWITRAANRRPFGLSVREAFIEGIGRPSVEATGRPSVDGHAGAYTPLWLHLEMAADMLLEKEIACLAPLARASWQPRKIAEVPELAEAHAKFYDATYFQTKRGESTRRYRRLINAPSSADDATDARAEVASIAGTAPTFDARPSAAAFVNEVGFHATFDGLNVIITPDRAALDQGASQVRRALAGLDRRSNIGIDRRSNLGVEPKSAENTEEKHPGALLYLTKYFTPHPRGEPHFFVKPWAFVRTPPGWSSVLDGVVGEGFDILRGVVETDRFHAVPAVFQLHGPGRISMRRHAPMLRVIPVPRALLRAGYALKRSPFLRSDGPS